MIKKAQYKGWKSGIRSTGWVVLQQHDPVTNEFNWIETKTVGNVTMVMHHTMTEKYWLVDGKKFKKLKEAVAYIDTLV